MNTIFNQESNQSNLVDDIFSMAVSGMVPVDKVIDQLQLYKDTKFDTLVDIQDYVASYPQHA